MFIDARPKPTVAEFHHVKCPTCGFLTLTLRGAKLCPRCAGEGKKINLLPHPRTNNRDTEPNNRNR